MKKKFLRLRVLIPAAAVCILTMAMAVASGSNITSSDPLVSLSYLNGTFKTQILSQVQSVINTESAKLDSKLLQRINGVKTASVTQSVPTATHSRHICIRPYRFNGRNSSCRSGRTASQSPVFFRFLCDDPSHSSFQNSDTEIIEHLLHICCVGGVLYARISCLGFLFKNRNSADDSAGAVS